MYLYSVTEGSIVLFLPLRWFDSCGYLPDFIDCKYDDIDMFLTTLVISYFAEWTLHQKFCIRKIDLF